MSDKLSYTSANIDIPIKLLHEQVMENGKIKPIHAQVILTNKCNLKCEFCSCADRNKQQEIPFEEVLGLLSKLKKLGTKAITWTGGGEPLMYEKINEVLEFSDNLDIKNGLVTNGTLLDKLEISPTWCRISSGDDRSPDILKIAYAKWKHDKTDWAFSHVVSSSPNHEVIGRIVDFANRNNFTHVRLVSDLLNLKDNQMGNIKNYLQSHLIPDDLVIYQNRQNYEIGKKECYISLLKPVIGADKKVYPCCGSQYQNKGQKRDMLNSMGDIKELEKIITDQKYFNGEKCDVCYYNNYNKILDLMVKNPKHKEFV